jgi:hypothetical protein
VCECAYVSGKRVARAGRSDGTGTDGKVDVPFRGAFISSWKRRSEKESPPFSFFFFFSAFGGAHKEQQGSAGRLL